MRKIIFLLFCSMSVSFVNAQKVYAWMDAGVKLGWGLTGMLNSNLFDDKNYEHHLTTGTSVGGKIGLFIGLYNGVTFDLMLSDNNQKFDFNDAQGVNRIHTIEWKNLDLAVLYRMQKDGVYLEIGPQFSFVNKVNQTNPLDPLDDVTKFYSKHYISGVFGIGGYLFNYENFTTMLGLRMGYGLTDMINDEGKKITPPYLNAYPTPTEVKPYSPAKTSAAWVQLNLEFNFALGFYGKSSCSKRATFFHF
jgi:hypothetical protein